MSGNDPLERSPRPSWRVLLLGALILGTAVVVAESGVLKSPDPFVLPDPTCGSGTVLHSSSLERVFGMAAGGHWVLRGRAEGSQYSLVAHDLRTGERRVVAGGLPSTAFHGLAVAGSRALWVHDGGLSSVDLDTGATRRYDLQGLRITGLPAADGDGAIVVAGNDSGSSHRYLDLVTGEARPFTDGPTGYVVELSGARAAWHDTERGVLAHDLRNGTTWSVAPPDGSESPVLSGDLLAYRTPWQADRSRLIHVVNLTTGDRSAVAVDASTLTLSGRWIGYVSFVEGSGYHGTARNLDDGRTVPLGEGYLRIRFAGDRVVTLCTDHRAAADRIHVVDLA